MKEFRITETKLVEEIVKAIDSVDSDELARIAENILGGECFLDVESEAAEDVYIFTPNKNYGGCFGELKKATNDLFPNPDTMDAKVTTLILRLMQERGINPSSFPYVAINKELRIWAHDQYPLFHEDRHRAMEGTSVLVFSFGGKKKEINEYIDELNYMRNSLFRFNPDA